MERRMAPIEPECGRTMTPDDNEEVIHSLPASEQLSTRCCARCEGLLVTEWYYDLDNTGEPNIETFRCVQCGHRVDPVILQNRIQPPVKSRPEQQARPRYPTRTGVLSKFA